jgi:hypothetical protein
LSICGLLVGSDGEAKGPFGSIKVGNWSGGAFTNDNTGQFSGCIGGAPYLNGIYFMVSMDPAGAWSLAFTHPSWRLQPGETFPIDHIRRSSAVSRFRSRVPNNMVSLLMPANSALMIQFRKALSMVAYAKGLPYQFNLTSLNCCPH